MRAPIIALSLLLHSAAAVAAQETTPRAPLQPARAFAGGALVYGAPQGDFADQIDQGFGAHGHFLYDLGGGGWMGLRVEGGGLVYGQERRTVPLSPTIGGRITVDVVTSNNIAFFGLGPQIGLPTGRFRPYANGFAGVTLLSTTSSVSGTRSHEREPFASTTNHDDAVFAYGGGAGVYVPLRGGARPVSLDVGATYRRSGEAEYLREGDIRDNPNGTITVSPVRSRTDLLNVHVGVSVGIGSRRR